MRIEIHRWRMAMAPRADGRVAVAYDILVPLKDCPRVEGMTIRVRPGEGEYVDYASATWSTDLPRGWDRYRAWLRHERNARRQMLGYLHEHCPETREIDRWPALWAYVRPEDAQGLRTVFFTLDAPVATAERPMTAAGAGVAGDSAG